MMSLLRKLMAFAGRATGISSSSSYNEFLPAGAEIVATPPSPVRIALLIAICALLLVSLIASWFGKIDIYAVAQGRIQPIGRSKVVQPLSAGRILAIFVKNGTPVRAGDVLIELDATEAGADRSALATKVNALNAEIARRQTAIEAARNDLFAHVPAIPLALTVPLEMRMREQAVLEADLAQLSSSISLVKLKIAQDRAKLGGIFAIIAAHENLIATLTERTHMREGLADQGWDSRASVLEANADLQREVTANAEAYSQRAELQAEIATYQQQVSDAIAKFVGDNTEAIRTAAGQRDQNYQDLIKATAKLGFTRLTAPIDGTVQELSATTIGQVVSAGQQLLTIVPGHASLEVVALVQNEDVGFVVTGQPAVVKIDAFPFTRFGTIDATVQAISRDSVDLGTAEKSASTQQQGMSPQQADASPIPKTQNLVFPVTLALSRASLAVDGVMVPLTPGMTVTVEIKTGQRRVIDYLLSPLRQTVSETAHER